MSLSLSGQIGAHLFERSDDGSLGLGLLRKLGSVVRLRPGVYTTEYMRKIGVPRRVLSDK